MSRSFQSPKFFSTEGMIFKNIVEASTAELFKFEGKSVDSFIRGRRTKLDVYDDGAYRLEIQVGSLPHEVVFIEWEPKRKNPYSEQERRKEEYKKFGPTHILKSTREKVRVVGKVSPASYLYKMIWSDGRYGTELLENLIPIPEQDPTEGIRRAMIKEDLASPGSRVALEAEYGQVWDTEELQRDFDVLGFMAPFVVVRRKSDGVKGSLQFQHNPRFYYSFTADNPMKKTYASKGYEWTLKYLRVHPNSVSHSAIEGGYKLFMKTKGRGFKLSEPQRREFYEGGETAFHHWIKGRKNPPQRRKQIRGKGPEFGSHAWQEMQAAEITRKLMAGEYLTPMNEAFLHMQEQHEKRRFGTSKWTNWQQKVKEAKMVHTIQHGTHRHFGPPRLNPPMDGKILRSKLFKKQPGTPPFEIVLAEIVNKHGLGVSEYVTWFHNLHDGGYSMGHYFAKLPMAIADYEKRIAKELEYQGNPHYGREKRYRLVLRNLDSNIVHVSKESYTLAQARKALNKTGHSRNASYRIEQEPVDMRPVRDAAGHYISYANPRSGRGGAALGGRGPVLIGRRVKAVEYWDEKKARAEGLANPTMPWRHDYKRGGPVYGLPNGDVLIKAGKKKLWGYR